MKQDFDWLGHGPVTLTAVATILRWNAGICVLLVPALNIIYLTLMSIQCPYGLIMSSNAHFNLQIRARGGGSFHFPVSGELRPLSRLVWLLVKHSL